MKHSVLVLSFVLVALTAPVARGETPAVSAGACAQAQMIGLERDATHVFAWQGRRYEVSASGLLTTKHGGQTIRRQLRFAPDGDDWIEKLYVVEHERDLVLVGEVSNGLDGAGFVMRVDGATHRAKWRAWLTGFNVGEVLLRERFAYVTAIGFVAKLDLATGRYVWQHDDLFPRNQAFNNFRTPFAEGTKIVFVGVGQYGGDGNEIVVDDRSGKIIEFRTSPSS